MRTLGREYRRDVERIGEFLRRRRARMTAAEVGLPSGGTRRRVAGLRREEVALLAGVSPDYYIRLEQGRTANVSDQVLLSVARALRLSSAETEHLTNLARPGRTPAVATPVKDGFLVRLLEALAEVPAVLLDGRLDLIAWNDAAEAVFELHATPEPRNAARQLFLQSGQRDRYTNWADIAADTVAQLRLSAGRQPDDPRLQNLIGELSIHSGSFQLLWALGDAREKREGAVRMNHPLAGRLEFDYESLSVAAAPDCSVLTYLPRPGSGTTEAIQDLLRTTDAPAS